MPAIVDRRSRGTDGAGANERFKSAEVDFNYVYPDNLKLKPGSPVHEKILSEVLQRARSSHEVMAKRHPQWRELDKVLTAFVAPDIEEQRRQQSDKRKPISLVVPVMYPVLETILAYHVTAFGKDVLCRYSPTGPEDTLGAMLLELVIDHQNKRNRSQLELHTQWRSNFIYGFGAVAVSWDRKYVKRAVPQQDGYFSQLLRRFIPQAEYRTTETVLAFEGNVLNAIDPYKYLPDPNYPVDQIQRGEYVGWITTENYTDLYASERNASRELFNVKYLKELRGTGTTSILSTDASGRDPDSRLETARTTNSFGTSTVDVINMYVKIIPRDWGLGDSENVEKWFFSVAADNVVIAAAPMGLNHDMFPVCVYASEFDGFSLSPISRAEVIQPLQHASNWFMSSHITNVIRSINDMFVVDPFLLEMEDFNNPRQGGRLLRLRKAGWGQNKLDQAIKQLNVVDVTKQHVQDTQALREMAQMASGAVDSTMGVLRRVGERRSASAERDARVSALNRLERGARAFIHQTLYDYAVMAASHTQQLMEESRYYAITGRWVDQLAADYGMSQGSYVKPSDLLIDYDVDIGENSMFSGEYVDVWTEVLTTLIQNPELAQTFDTGRIFKHWARLAGAKNINDFQRQPMQAPAMQVMPTEQLQQQVQAGNLVPIESIAS